MNPNDARIRRIYTRELNSTIVDDSLDANAQNELVVEWEAGSQVNALAVNLTLSVVTRNISTNNNEPLPLTQVRVETTNGNAVNTGYTVVINIPVGTLNQGDMYECIGSLLQANAQIHSFSNWWVFLAY